MRYKSTFTDTDSGSSATRRDKNAAIAVCEAVHGSGTITPQALIIGVLFWGIIEEHLAPDEQAIARRLIDSIGVPMNMRDLDEIS